MARRSDGPSSEQVAIVMVGLPARGKTFLASKLVRYLRWRGYEIETFNVGDYRREHLGARQPADFFDSSNTEAVRRRDAVAQVALGDMLAWFKTGGEVGIYDATNTTRDRRKLVADQCRSAGLNTLFMESICNDEQQILDNIRATKLQLPDYDGVDDEIAIADFRARIRKYEEAYETVGDDEGSYIKYVDVGKQILVNDISGVLPGRLVSVLLNSHLGQRPIYLSRHGESTFNIEQRIGGDPPLTDRGESYATNLAEHLVDTFDEQPVVLTSTLVRTRQTASKLPWPHHMWHLLDEIDAGICDGMTYAEIAVDFEHEFKARKADKFWYRYPRGESYADVIARLEPVIFELERLRKPVVVIAHQAVLRAVYAYFKDMQPSECPHVQMPLHTVIKLTPGEYGFEEDRMAL